MLSISKPLTSSKVQSYYRADYSAASSSYYSESETLRGDWHGKIAAEFGLEGQQIKAEHFDRLAEGLHPLTGERLIEHRPVSIPERPKWETDNTAWTEHLATIYLSAPATPFTSGFVPAGDVEAATRSPRKSLAEKVRTEQQKSLIAMHEEAAQIYRENLTGPEGEKAREYLAKRGITPELAAEFGLGVSINGNQLAARLAHYGPELMDASGLFAQRAGKFYDRQRERLMFPIQSASGETIAFAGRSLDGGEPKYINSPETDIYKKSEVLYNLHRAKDAAAEAGKTVVVEGYTDVIAAHKAGVKNGVAACGTALTKEHAEALSRTASGVVLNLDGDAPGVKATARSVPILLEKGLDVSVVTLAQDHDPAALVEIEGGAKFYKFFVENGAESVYQWAFRTSQEGRDMADPFEQAAAAKQAINLLQSVPAEHRDRCAADFARYLGIEANAEEKAEKKNVAHRAGNDLTLSCPKSGSLAALVGGDERVLVAHRKAVLAVNEAAEELIQARMGGNRAPVTTGKCIIAAFEHDTARPVDGYAAPQLHTHEIFFNLTADESGQARSIQNHELYVCSSYLTAVYQNVYEAEIRQAGYRIRRGKNHAPEIDGFTQEYLDAESPRSEEIDKEMEAKGLTGARARSIAAHSTREKKLNLSPEEVKAMHLAHAEMYGNQPQRIVAEARAQAVKEMTQEEAAWLAQRCVNFARVKLSERSSVFDHHEVMTAALRHARGRTGVPEIKRELDTQKAAGAFIEVSHIRANAPLYRYTTPELIADERTSIEKMLAGRGTVEPFKHTPEFAHLNEEQKRVVEFVRDSRDQIIGIQGKAGTGKTVTLAAINEMVRAEGYTTHGLAPSSKATKALKEIKGAGIQALTIQKFLMMPKEQGVRRCYILDETSQTSASQFRRLAEQMHPTDRLIVVGDVNQHDSVEAGRIFDELQQAGMSTIHLDKIVRQNDAGLLKAVEAFSDRDVRTGIELLREQGRIVSIPHRGERFAAMAKEYVAHPAMRLVVNPDNPTRKELGSAIREERKAVGQVAKEDYSLRILVGKDVTGPDRTVAGSYEPGDEVKYNGAHKYLGIKAGEYATVTKSDHEKNEITVEFAKTGRTLTYNPEQAIGVEIYAPEIRPIAVGDRLQFTQASKALGVSNRDTGEVQGLETQNGNIRIKLDGGRVVGFNLKDYRHLDYAYVMTSHSSQSMTETAGMAHFDTGDSQIRKLVTDTAAYVATSRFTDHFTIYTDDADNLVKALSHHEQNATALSPKQVRDYREEMVA